MSWNPSNHAAHDMTGRLSVHDYGQTNLYPLSPKVGPRTLPTFDRLGLPSPTCRVGGTILHTASDCRIRATHYGDGPSSSQADGLFPCLTGKFLVGPSTPTRACPEVALHSVTSRRQQPVVLLSHRYKLDSYHTANKSQGRISRSTNSDEWPDRVDSDQPSSKRARNRSPQLSASGGAEVRTGRMTRTAVTEARKDLRGRSRAVPQAGLGCLDQQPVTTNVNREPGDKNDKEALKRTEHGSLLQDMEDTIELLAGVPLTKAQGTSNGNRAGLNAVKTEVYIVHIAIAARILQELRQEAILNRELERWERKLQDIADDARESHAPLSGTWLGGEKCRHQRNSESCTTHGHTNHTQCRKSRRMQSFQASQQKLYQQLD